MSVDRSLFGVWHDGAGEVLSDGQAVARLAGRSVAPIVGDVDLFTGEVVEAPAVRAPRAGGEQLSMI